MRQFGRFVRAADVTMLGVVPSIVRAWRHSDCMAGLTWQRLRCFSSTGEASSPQVRGTLKPFNFPFAALPLSISILHQVAVLTQLHHKKAGHEIAVHRSDFHDTCFHRTTTG